MQTKKVQAILYKIEESGIKCLCLKRNEADGGFWHVLTGTLEKNENWQEGLLREISEEIGKQEIVEISKPLKKWIWKKDQEEILVCDFAIIIESATITLNDEHVEYTWLPLNYAYERLEKESAKEMITLSENILLKYDK